MSTQHVTPADGVSPTQRKRVLLALSYYDYRHHSGAAKYATERGWALDDAFTQLKSLPTDWKGDGIISFHGDNAEYVRWLGGMGVPVVDIGENSDFSDFPRVCGDHKKLGTMAVDHFAARGYKTLAFTWLIERPVHRARLEAIRAEAHMRRMRLLELPLSQLGQLQLAGAFPVGVIAANDAVAVRALRACEDAGILVPEQAAILGIDNFEYRCVPASVSLSSIDSAQEKIGYEAAALLDRLMNGESAPAQTLRMPPVGVVERDSTDMHAVSDVEVARALRYIIRSFRTQVGLRDVARATGISLRRLQTRFKECLGRTILQEINGRRVRYAQKQLEQTTKRIRVIADEVGFGSAVKMIRVFQQYAGTSPKRYRKQASDEAMGETRAGLSKVE